MFNKKEIPLIIGVVIILALALSFLKNLEVFLYSLLFVFLVLMVNILAKKISSFYFDSEIEIELWRVKRYGFKPSKYFKKPFPAGVLFPLLFSIFTLGNFVWLASLIFKVKPKVYRSAKRHGLYNFSEMTESNIGFIAASGIAANLVFAILAYLLGFSELARINLYYAFFNILPISNLDGNKIFFGSTELWIFLVTLVSIGIGFALFSI